MAQRPAKVVVADDASEIRLLMRIGLRRSGRIQVIGEAINGREAVTLTEELSPDVVILDVSMPVMDGLEAAGEIRRRFADLGIVIYSGFRADDLERRALQAGADSYIEKTGDLASLEAAVLQVFSQRSGNGLI